MLIVPIFELESAAIKHSQFLCVMAFQVFSGWQITLRVQLGSNLPQLLTGDLTAAALLRSS